MYKGLDLKGPCTGVRGRLMRGAADGALEGLVQHFAERRVGVHLGVGGHTNEGKK